MDSLLSVLAMIGGLLVLGWLIGSDEEHSVSAETEDPPQDRASASAAPVETP